MAGLVLTLRVSETPRPIRGTAHLQRCLKELQTALVHEIPEDVAVAMANLQGCMDWYQVSNDLQLNPQRIEAEYYRYEECDEETTVRDWPPQ